MSYFNVTNKMFNKKKLQLILPVPSLYY